MLAKVLALFCFVWFGSSAFALNDTKLAAAKQKFAQSHDGEVARQAYVATLAAMLRNLNIKYINTGRSDENDGKLFDELDAELKAHPAPEGVDSKRLSKLRVGKWQSPRHTYTYRADGTAQMDLEDGLEAAGYHPPISSWHISGNQYFDAEMDYTIICLNNRDFVFTDGEAVFHERRLSK